MLGVAATAHVLELQDAFAGSIQNLVLDADQGGRTTVRQWVQTNVTQSLTLKATQAVCTLFSGDGNDQITASGDGDLNSSNQWAVNDAIFNERTYA